MRLFLRGKQALKGHYLVVSINFPEIYLTRILIKDFLINIFKTFKHIYLKVGSHNTKIIITLRLVHIDDIPSGSSTGQDEINFNKAYNVSLLTCINIFIS